MPEKIIMSPEDIRRTVARIAHEIIERNTVLDNIILVGIRTRGIPLAERLAENIRRFEKVGLPVGSLDFSLHRDDIASSKKKKFGEYANIPTSINNKTIVLVDDVINTGRSIRAAIDALVEVGRPSNIQLAVLIDRGHREMPIRADYVGKNIPSSHNEAIKVRLTETDTRDAVAIIKADSGLGEK